MGVVYGAERADAAFKRVVAIKVVRRAAHAADIIERFHRERVVARALGVSHATVQRVWREHGLTPVVRTDSTVSSPA
jgi:hypothetical protein